MSDHENTTGTPQDTGQDGQGGQLSTTDAQTPAGGIARPQRGTIAMGARGVILTSFDELQRLAMMISSSGMGGSFNGNPAAAAVAMLVARELGQSDMWGIQNIAVINGRATVYGDGLLGLCKAHPEWDPELFEEKEFGTIGNDGYGWTCQAPRFGNRTVNRTFTWADAKRAGLLGKSGPWTQYPGRMIQLRARAFALRDQYPDILRGSKSSVEVADYDAATQAQPRARLIEARPIDAAPEYQKEQ